MNKLFSDPATDIPFLVTIIMGEDDWVLNCDDGASPKVIEHLQKQHGRKSNFYILPSSGHNMNLDNKDALVNLVLNECLGGDRPILPREKYLEVN